MLQYFTQLSGKNKPHYAALEVERLSYDGQEYISHLFKTSPFRIRIGLEGLENPALLLDIPNGKDQKKGGGRKKLSHPEITNTRYTSR